MKPQPIVWSIAGTDPSGGAGIQADLKTMNALGVHGCSVITAVVAQNTQGVRLVEYPSAEMLQQQLDALRDDMPPKAVKIGMLGPSHTLQRVGRLLDEVDAFVVCDPVFASSSGTTFLSSDAVDAFRAEILPRIDLLTPNLSEAEALLGRAIEHTADMEIAARELVDMGPTSILLKGGHLDSTYSQDFWTNGQARAWLTLPRRDVSNTHGTGCVLSAAIASSYALGFSELDSLVIAKAYVSQGLRKGGGLGRGRGPLHLGPWPSAPEDLPWITPTAEEGTTTARFPDCGPKPLGLYPIVDRVDWLKKLLPLGISTVQLRIKDLHGEDLEKEIRSAIAYARRFDARLFINDQWELALKHGAYGVHIGQDDLPSTQLDALRKAGMRLGISTHSYSEIARAWACRPSYAALGTLFETTSKIMDYPALGLEHFTKMRRLLAIPAVAIGGIHLEQAERVLDAGADGVAVISEIREAIDLEKRVAAWTKLFERRINSVRT